MHYQKNTFGGWTSEANNPDFFISPTGKKDPDAELKAELSVITEKRLVSNQPFECVFPVRYEYLKSSFGIRQERSPCPRLEGWKAQFAGESATVIFATSYMGNAASVFGHVFLKVNATAGLNPKSELLDLGISFAAKNDPNDNPIIYAWKGLTGKYLEEFSIMSYFTRLSEYHNIENRDVWEYKLKLKPDQVHRLLDHIWELMNAQMNYVFINRNCAYHLSILLQVADPDLRLTEHFAPWVVPVDSIKALVQSEAVSQIRLRPSIYHKLKQKILAMSEPEQAAFEKSKQADLQLFGGESSLVLESLLDYQQFMIHPSNRELLPVEKSKQAELFSKLTAAPISTVQLPSIIADTQPDLGQPSKKLSLMAGSGPGDHFADLEFRPTLHDLLDNDEGYTPFSQVEAGRIKLRYSETQSNLSLQNLDLVNIVSLTPVDSILLTPSWTLQAGALVPPDTACPTCISGGLQLGAGLSRYLLQKTENGIAFALLKLNAEGGAGTPGSFRFGPSELIGFDVRLGPSIKLLSEFELTQYLSGQWTFESGAYSTLTTGISWSSGKSFELRLNGLYQWLPTQSSGLVNLATGFYF